MKKQILFICDNGLKFGVLVDELSASKVAKRIIANLAITTKEFICISDYITPEGPNQEIGIRTKTIDAVVIADISNIQVPSNKIFVPGGKPN